MNHLYVNGREIFQAAIVQFPNLKLYQLDADTLSLENLAGGTWKNLKMGALELTSTLTMANNTAFQLKNAAGTAQNVLYMNTSDWVQLSSPSGTLALNRSTATDIDVWGVVGTGRTLNLYGSDAADGELNDSPTLKLVGFYDADPTAGVTNTAFPYSVLLNMTAGGAAPAASGLHKINNVTVLTLTNTNGTPTATFPGAATISGDLTITGAIVSADYLNLKHTVTTRATTLYGGTSDLGQGGAIIVWGCTHANTGALSFYTPNAATTGDILRLNITGVATTAIAQWASVVHTGFKAVDTASFGNTDEGYTGSINIKTVRQVVNLSGAQTSTTINIPAGAMLLGASFNVDTAVVTSAATNTWDADFTGGSTTNLVAAGAAGAQNTKANKLIVPEIASAETNIEFDAPGAETFSSGAIEVVAYYIDQTSLANA